MYSLYCNIYQNMSEYAKLHDLMVHHSKAIFVPLRSYHTQALLFECRIDSYGFGLKRDLPDLNSSNRYVHLCHTLVNNLGYSTYILFIFVNLKLHKLIHRSICTILCLVRFKNMCQKVYFLI